jgi:hypothetical protein
MAGGLPVFVALTKPTAASLNIVAQSTVMCFDDVADRDAQVAAPTRGMFAVTIDADTLWYYDGTVWQAALASEPTAVTPIWTGLTVGNGVQVADIQNVGLKQLRYKGEITFGTTTSVTGNVILTIPSSLTSAGTPSAGTATFNDTGTRLYPGQVRVTPSDTAIAFVHAESGNGGLTNSTSPFTFTTGDVIGWDITVGVA